MGSFSRLNLDPSLSLSIPSPSESHLCLLHNRPSHNEPHVTVAAAAAVTAAAAAGWGGENGMPRLQRVAGCDSLETEKLCGAAGALSMNSQSPTPPHTHPPPPAPH